MRYLVLLRHGFGVYTVALTVSRARQGHISCVESLALKDADEAATGMTWRVDGRYRVTKSSGVRRDERRVPLTRLAEPEVAFRIPGHLLSDARRPVYTPDRRGATVQLAAEAVLDEPHRVELHVLVTPRGHVPPHRETVGDRLIDDGEPSIWMVLARQGDDDGHDVVARYGTRPRPSFRAAGQL